MNKRHILEPAEATDASRTQARGNTIWTAVGRQLALRRAALGYSAERVAHGVGLTVADYSAYENGAPIPAFLLGELAELLDCDVPWFFEGVGRHDQPGEDIETGAEVVTYTVATVEHRIQALTESFRRLDFESQQHLLAISRALSRACAGATRE